MIDRPATGSTHSIDDDPRNRDLMVWLNGAIVPHERALVSVYDSGFMLGDGMWESMRLKDGVWVFRDEHLDRLFHSCRTIELDPGMSPDQFRQALDDIARANDMQTDAHCRLMVTRGVKTRPFQHPHFSQTGPTVTIVAEHSRPVSGLHRDGVSLATVPQVRGLPMSQDAKLNSHSKLNCVIACLQARQAGADEALMLDPYGFVNTTNSCNFFVVRNGEVWTSTGDYCMSGITRRKVIGICREKGIPVHERNYSLHDAYNADEAFLTGTFGGQTPVSSIDNRSMPGPYPGKVTRLIQKHYRELIRDHVNTVTRRDPT